MKHMTNILTACLFLIFSCWHFHAQAQFTATLNYTTFLALYFIVNSSDEPEPHGEILLYGKYTDGAYSTISDYDWETSGSTGERSAVLENNRSYTIYYRGNQLDRAWVDEIDTADYDCEQLIVGRCENKLTKDVIKQKQNEYTQYRSVYTDGEERQYSLTNFIAVNSDKLSDIERMPMPRTDTSELILIEDQVKKDFLHHNMFISGFSLRPESVNRISLSAVQPSTFTCVATAADTLDEKFMSMLSILELKEGKVITLYEEFNELEMDSWGNGFEFIDALDIDDDGIAELFFRVDGYESSDLYIYKYAEGKFSIILQAWLYGC